MAAELRPSGNGPSIDRWSWGAAHRALAVDRGLRVLTRGWASKPYRRSRNGLWPSILERRHRWPRGPGNRRDLDATNGQDLYVADGARVLRFSDEGRLVQTLRIPGRGPAERRRARGRAARRGRLGRRWRRGHRLRRRGHAQRRAGVAQRAARGRARRAGRADRAGRRGPQAVRRRPPEAHRPRPRHIAARLWRRWTRQRSAARSTCRWGRRACSCSARRAWSCSRQRPSASGAWTSRARRLLLDAAIQDGVLFALTSHALTALGRVPPPEALPSALNTPARPATFSRPPPPHRARAVPDSSRPTRTA